MSITREGMGAKCRIMEEVTWMELEEETQPENGVDTWPESEHHGSAGRKGFQERSWLVSLLLVIPTL